MPDAPVNAGLSNLSMLTLRRVHRQARYLAIISGVPIPVVITWRLGKLPESVSASDQVAMMTTQVEMTALKKGQGFKGGLKDDIDEDSKP